MERKLIPRSSAAFFLMPLVLIEGLDQECPLDLLHESFQIKALARNVEIEAPLLELEMFIQIGAQVLGRQLLGAFEGDRSLDDVLKLPDIARIVIVEKDPKRLGRDSRNALIQFGRKFLKKMHGQARNVFPSLSQGREFDLDDIKAIEEILPKPFLPDGFFEVLIGRRNDPDVDRGCPRSLPPA